jgi:hypothetical protein
VNLFPKKNVLVERGACRVKKCTRPCPFDGYKANEIARGRGRGGSRKKEKPPNAVRSLVVGGFRGAKK